MKQSERRSSRAHSESCEFISPRRPRRGAAPAAAGRLSSRGRRTGAPRPRRRRKRRPSASRSSRTGEDVVDAMHDRYLGKWYTTLTFRQKTSRLLANGKWNVQTWYEAMKLPGRLRIDFDPVSAGNGVLYARDSQFVVQNGRAAARRSGDQSAAPARLRRLHGARSRTRRRGSGARGSTSRACTRRPSRGSR